MLADPKFWGKENTEDPETLVRLPLRSSVSCVINSYSSNGTAAP